MGIYDGTRFEDSTLHIYSSLSLDLTTLYYQISIENLIA